APRPPRGRRPARGNRRAGWGAARPRSGGRTRRSTSGSPGGGAVRARASLAPVAPLAALGSPEEEEVDGHRRLLSHVPSVLRKGRENEGAHGAPEEAGQGVAVERLQVAAGDALLHDGKEHRAEGLHLLDLAGPGARRDGAGEEPVLGGDGEEGPVRLH